MNNSFGFHHVFDTGLFPESSRRTLQSSQPESALANLWALDGSDDLWAIDKRDQPGQLNEDAKTKPVMTSPVSRAMENVTPEVLGASREIRALTKKLGAPVLTLLCIFLKYTEMVKVPVTIDNFIFYLKNWAMQDLKAGSPAVRDDANETATRNIDSDDDQPKEVISMRAAMKTLQLKRKSRNKRHLRNKQLMQENQVNSAAKEVPKQNNSNPIYLLTSRQLRMLAMKNIMAKRKPLDTEKSMEIKKVVNENKIWKCRPVIKKVTCVRVNGIMTFAIEKSTRRCKERLSLEELLMMKVEAKLLYES